MSKKIITMLCAFSLVFLVLGNITPKAFASDYNVNTSFSVVNVATGSPETLLGTYYPQNAGWEISNFALTGNVSTSTGNWKVGTLTLIIRNGDINGTILATQTVNVSGTETSEYFSLSANAIVAKSLAITLVNNVTAYNGNTAYNTWYYGNSFAIKESEYEKIQVDTLATANNAQTAAQNAQTAAQAAQIAAQAAQGGTNTIINSYLSTSAGIIQDSSGNTALSVAKQASQNAQNAYNQAVTATNSANTASTNAANANTNATNAYNQAITATNGINAANTTLGISAGVVQDSSGTVLQSARKADTDIQDAQTSLSNQMSTMQSSLNNRITSIQNYMTPNLNKMQGLNGATATTATSFNVLLQCSGANEYQYKVDNGSWSSWTSLSSVITNGYFTISGISTSGIHTAYVQLRYNYGSGTSPETSGSTSFFKL